MPASRDDDKTNRTLVRRLAWFVGLWLLGVGAVTVVGLLIKAML